MDRAGVFAIAATAMEPAHRSGNALRRLVDRAG